MLFPVNNGLSVVAVLSGTRMSQVVAMVVTEVYALVKVKIDSVGLVEEFVFF